MENFFPIEIVGGRVVVQKAWFGVLPPALHNIALIHTTHVLIIIVTIVLEISKKLIAGNIYRIIVKMAVGNNAEYFRPHGRVQSHIFVYFIFLQYGMLSETPRIAAPLDFLITKPYLRIDQHVCKVGQKIYYYYYHRKYQQYCLYERIVALCY